MIVQEAPVFDAARYKATTLQQWDVAAAAWDRWSPLLREWVDDPSASPGDLEALARTDETAWQDARREFTLY